MSTTLLCKNKGAGSFQAWSTQCQALIFLFFFPGTEMGPRSLDNSYTVQTTKVTCVKGQSSLRVLGIRGDSP